MARAIWEVRIARPGAAIADLDQQGDAIRVTITALRVARPDTVLLLARGTGTLLAATRYTLQLAGRASSARQIGASIREAGAVRARGPVPLKPQWQKNALALRVSEGKPLITWELCFELGQIAGEIELDDLTLRDAG